MDYVEMGMARKAIYVEKERNFQQLLEEKQLKKTDTYAIFVSDFLPLTLLICWLAILYCNYNYVVIF